MRRKVGTVAAAAGLVGVLGASAAAVPVHIPSEVELYGGDYSTWQVGTDQPDICSPAPHPLGVAVMDGQFHYSPSVDDAFDDGHFVLVDGVPTAAISGSLQGQSLTYGPTFGAVKTWVTHTALGKGPALRTLVRLKNTTASPQTRTIGFHSNGGGDAAETTEGTSDGDKVLETTDDWIVWTPGDSDPAEDPAKATALTGPGKVRSGITTISFAPGDPVPVGGNDCLAVDFKVRVPAGQTRSLLFFTWLDTSAMGAGGRAGDYTAMKPYLFEGISAAQRNTVVNWRL